MKTSLRHPQVRFARTSTILLSLIVCGSIHGADSGAQTSRTLRVPGDFPTIQAAITAAQSGDTVLVSAGTYRERLKLKPRVTVRSEGADARGRLGLLRAEATILDGTSGTGPGVQMADDAVLDGFTVTGVGKFDDVLWQQHFDTRGNGQRHEHIGQPGTPGIAAESGGAILNNIVHHIGYTGIAVTGAPGRKVSPRVAGNFCYRNMGGGIGSLDGSTAVIEGNTCFENFHAGIGHHNASPLVRSNTCYGNVRAGIGISEGSSPTVTGNRCFQNRRAGIGIRTGRGTQPAVEVNECFDNGMAGIGVEEEARPTLSRNRCRENRFAGIGISDKSEARVLGNECLSNGEAGIGLRGGARAEIIGNRLASNNLVAIGVTGGSTARIAGNEIMRAGGMPPLIAVLDASRATVESNTIHGGGVAGVLVEGTAEVLNNRFLGTGARRSGPPNIAVWAKQGSTVNFSGNHVEGWRQALSAIGTAEVVARTNEVSGFSVTAIVVKSTKKPAEVSGNVAFSNDKNARAAEVSGAAGEVSANVVRPAKGAR
jgi:parallel beta-helix repeat protein